MENLTQIKNEYILSLSKCHDIRKRMVIEMKNGTKTNGCKMLESKVIKLPNGNEKGIYYGFDWGGTNMRFIRIELKINQKPKMDILKLMIPKYLQTCNDRNNLFEFIANQFKILLIKHNELENINYNKRIFSVGFTFSFPYKQSILNEGILLEWTKGYNIPNIINYDIVLLINNYFNKYNIPLRIDSILNDTISTLISSCYYYRNTKIGVIIGTGTNSAYIQHQNGINKVINIEWGNFDQNKKVLQRTKIDIFMDKYTSNPQSYLASKSISGRYIGELCRLLVIQIFCDRKIPKKSEINTKFGEFNGYFVAEILQIHYINNRYYSTQKILKLLQTKFNLQFLDKNDIKVIIHIFIMIINRSADLVSCLLLGVLQKMGFYKEIKQIDNMFVLNDKYKHKFISIGIDGGLFLNMPMYAQRIRKTMVSLIGEEIVNRIHIESVKDGSTIGAALCVAALHRNIKHKL